MHTIADITRLLDLNNKMTPRNWATEFGEHLSETATPEVGETRRFTNHDLDILYTIKLMREQRHSSERIHAALASGDITPYEPPQGEGVQEDEEPIDRAMVAKLTATVAAYEARATAIEEERDRLLAELGSERSARLSAEIERAKLEGRLEELLARPPSFWRRLLGG